MRNIGCKLSAQCIALFALGDIQKHKHRTGHHAASRDRIRKQLAGGSVDGHDSRTADSFQRIMYQIAEDLAAVEIKDIEFALDRYFVEQLQSRMVMREHPAGCTDQQQPLLHIVRQDTELFLLTLQLVFLRLHLHPEAGELPCDRAQLRKIREGIFRIQLQFFQLGRSFL